VEPVTTAVFPLSMAIPNSLEREERMP
jgi:hypothetical protein